MVRVCLLHGSQCLFSKSCCRHAHLDSRFRHAIKGVTASFGRRAFIYQISQNGSGGKHSKVNIV